MFGFKPLFGPLGHSERRRLESRLARSPYMTPGRGTLNLEKYFRGKQPWAHLSGPRPGVGDDVQAIKAGIMDRRR